MIKRVAVDPLLPDTPERIILLARDLKISRGRHLDVVVKDWQSTVAAHGRTIEDRRDRMRFEEGLKRLLHHPGAYVQRRAASGPKWEIEVSTRGSELDTVATDRALGLTNAVSYVEVESEATAWCTTTTIDVPRNPDAYAGALAPLARVSDRVWIVDPYYLKNRGSMERLFVALARGFSGREPLEWVSVNTLNHGDESRLAASIEGALDDLKGHARTLRGLARRFRLAVWGGGKEGDRMHDRFFLTDVGGVGIGNWLDGNRRGVASFGLLDEEAWRELRASYDTDHPDHPNVSRFELMAEASVELEGVI